jgi:hypothetical protein
MATGKPKPKSPGDEEVRSLLVRYKCPIAFHAVRTRFLGSIASPEIGTSPIETVKSLWGGELPKFDSIDALNELIGALVMGLWNRLARHQDRKVPFRLLRIAAPTNRDALASLALVRHEELQGFVEGLFGTLEEMDLPERAHHALGELTQIRGLFKAVQDLYSVSTKPATKSDTAETTQNLRALTKIAEHEIHEAVLSCTKARRDVLLGLTTTKPRLH